MRKWWKLLLLEWKKNYEINKRQTKQESGRVDYANKPLVLCYWQILQCLTVQGLSSSSGNQYGGYSSDTSGVSRAMVKERLRPLTINGQSLTVNYASLRG
ncbi:hypothetical protein U1Q18_008083 [Sarracenia purpurea var. burkii]